MLANLEKERPHVILVSISDDSALLNNRLEKDIKKVKKLFPGFKILVFSAFEDDQHVFSHDKSRGGWLSDKSSLLC